MSIVTFAVSCRKTISASQHDIQISQADWLEVVTAFACNTGSFAIAFVFLSYLVHHVLVTDWEFCVSCAFMECALKMNSNGGSKWEHVESCPSITRKITTMPMATKLSKRMIYHEELPPIKSHDLLITWSREIT